MAALLPPSRLLWLVVQSAWVEISLFVCTCKVTFSFVCALNTQCSFVGVLQPDSIIKLSPLANLPKSDIWKQITDEDIPYNPLHDQGYPSIGCWPCTRSRTR